jgi:histidinol-phosphatase
VETKPDATPVTEADRAIEQELRLQINRDRPDDAIVGEEFGAAGDADRRWIIDPIDATKNYLRGIPVWATLIALEHGDELVLGVVSAPALGRRWWASRGDGAYVNGESIHVSGVRHLDKAHVAYDDIAGFDHIGLADEFLALCRQCARTRGFGDFWSHMLVAEGAVDIAIEPEGLKVWDLAPLLVIVEEAGGRFTDITGHRRADGGSAVATNGLLHDDVLGALGVPE